MVAALQDYLDEKREIINQKLQEYVYVHANVPPLLQEAMEYSLFPGGKRLRPILTLATAEALSSSLEHVIPFACALEMIHTYSLIHDDLPAMDNDDTRHGKPTNHKVYGDAMAILAGDALLTKAFGLMTQCIDGSNLEAKTVLQLIAEASNAAGAEGMVGGQVADLLSENKTITLEELYTIHEHKTGALLTLSVRAGAILAGADSVQLDALTQYAQKIGIAFQIKDDILDITGNQAKLGKPVGSDTENAKATFPAFLGVSESEDRLQTLLNDAKACLTNAPGINAQWLLRIADYMGKRDH